MGIVDKKQKVLYYSFATNPTGGYVQIDRWHLVVHALKRTDDMLKGIVPDFERKRKCATQDALVGTIIDEYNLKILLQQVETKPFLHFTIQVERVRVNGYFGGQFVFMWTGETSSLAGKPKDAFYLSKLLKNDREAKIVVEEDIWYKVIEELVRMATGNAKKVQVRIVAHNNHTTVERLPTLPTMPRLAVN